MSAILTSFIVIRLRDCRKRNAKIGSEFSNKTPQQVLVAMQKGNTRFWTGNSSKSEINAFERRALTHQQYPVAAVLGCADSRVPTETVFDQVSVRPKLLSSAICTWVHCIVLMLNLFHVCTPSEPW